MMTSRNTILLIVALIVVAVAGIWAFIAYKPTLPGTQPVLKVGIAPYQDMALLMNVAPLGLDKKHGIHLELLSVAWPDLTPAVASANPSVDLAFASLIQFISQEH